MADGNPNDMREFTIQTLENAGEGLTEFQKIFQQASDAFEDGRDSEGFQLINGELIPRIQEFTEFCGTLRNQCSTWLSEDQLKELDDMNQALSNTLQTVNNALESGDVLELADVLRTELSDSLEKYRTVFSNLKNQLTSA